MMPPNCSLWKCSFVIFNCFWDIGNGHPWYGFAPSFSFKETNSQSQSPSVPPNSSSKSYRNSSNKCFSGSLMCVKFSVISLQSAFSYLASRISMRCLVASTVLWGSLVLSWQMILFRDQDLSICALVVSLLTVSHGQCNFIQCLFSKCLGQFLTLSL